MFTLNAYMLSIVSLSIEIVIVISINQLLSIVIYRDVDTNVFL